MDFSKFPQTWAKIGLDLRKLWKNCVILLKILPKIKQIGTLMGQYFLKTWIYLVLLWVYFQSLRQHIPTKKQTWVPPGVFRWSKKFFHFSNSKALDPGVVTPSLIWAGI